MIKKALVVDDEVPLVMLLKDSLELSGYEVDTAYNGEEAVAKIKQNKPDIILLDVRMPKMNGWEVCKWVKNNPETKHIPVIMLSAYDQRSDIEKGLSLGAERYLIKPYDPTNLLKVLDEVMLPKP